MSAKTQSETKIYKPMLLCQYAMLMMMTATTTTPKYDALCFSSADTLADLKAEKYNFIYQTIAIDVPATNMPL